MKSSNIVSFIRILLLVLLGMFTISGCSKSTAKESQNKRIDSTISESKDDTEIKYADLIPDPEVIFPNGSISVTDTDGGKAYIFEVSDFNDGEFDSYISRCKELGFDDISYETSHEKGKDFGAYSSDGMYWVQVNLDAEKNIIYVICQAAKKTPEAEKAMESSGVSGGRNVSGFDIKANQTITWCGIDFSVPSYFDVLDEGSTETLIHYYPKEEDYYASIMFQMVEFTGTQEDFNNQIPSIIDSTMDGDYFANRELQKSEEISIAGLPGWTITYSVSDTEGDGVISTVSHSFTYNINTGKIVVISCSYDDNDQSQYDYLGDYKKVLETAKLSVEPLDLNAINSTKSADGVTPVFKEAMDSYEAFFDEYIAFMSKYVESDDTTSMLADYTKYLTQYADTMSKMDAMNESELSAADSAYYIEVQTRITQKLLEVAQE